MNIHKFIAAAVQAAPVFLNRDETVGKVLSLIEEASAGGAELIVFPEAFIPAYPYWPKDIGAKERKLIIDAYTELYKNSVEVPDETTDKIAAAAKDAGAYVVIGVNEREGGTLYNTILYFGKEGALIGKHRKLLSIDSEKCIWGMGGAEDLTVVDTALGKLGGFFCYEHHITLAKYAMYTKGEQIHAGLWAGHGFVKPTMDFSSRQYAFEGQLFVVAAAQHLTADMIPDSFPLKEHTLWDFPGGSCIINPRGEYIAGPLYDEEGILYAEIDTEMIIRAKAVIDGVGHFSRPDILSLNIKDAGFGRRNDKTSVDAGLIEEIEEVRSSIDKMAERQGKMEEKLGELIKSLSLGQGRTKRGKG